MSHRSVYKCQLKNTRPSFWQDMNYDFDFPAPDVTQVFVCPANLRLRGLLVYFVYQYCFRMEEASISYFKIEFFITKFLCAELASSMVTFNAKKRFSVWVLFI